MSVLTALPPTISRHELKYVIPYSHIDAISRFIEPFCSLDHYSAISPDGTYLINSLYFDTRNLEFLQQRMYGKDGRFNIRVRSYDEQGRAPYFLEIKRKAGTTGRKYRAVASDDEWPYIITDPSFRIQEDRNLGNVINKRLFLRTAVSYAIEPQILTQYRRRAFVSTVDDYARITMDTNMRYRLQDHYSLKPCCDMVNYDNETIYGDYYSGEGDVILELKCNIGQVPTWMLDLISAFNLKQQSFSKYVNSSLVSHFDNGCHYMNRDLMFSC